MSVYIWLLFLLYFYSFHATAERDLCRLFKDGTQLRKPGSCREYITCKNGTSVIRSCGLNSVYDLSRSSCVKESLGSGDSYCRHNCEGKDNYWVADLTSCHGFYYCSQGVGLKSSCPGGLHFDEARQMCVYVSDSSCIDVYNICQVAPAKVPFKDEANCNAFYECRVRKGKTELNKLTCGAHGYFDVHSGKCVKKYEVACEAHPIPNSVCGVDGKPKKRIFVSDQASCRGYFYCRDMGYVADLEPMWGQCPKETFFDEANQRCGKAHEVPCEYNRCEGRSSRRVESATNDCHNYWMCENGVPVEEKTCLKQHFFNSHIQACVPDIIAYPSCDYCKLNKC